VRGATSLSSNEPRGRSPPGPRKGLKAKTTNFRIAGRSLSISRAYLRTIERTALILLVSLPVRRPIAGDDMSTISIRQTERNGDKTAGRNRGALHGCAKCDGREASTSHYPRKAQRRQQCATVPNIFALAQPSVALSATASLASSGTTPGEPPSQRNALPASKHARRTIADGYLGFKPSDMLPNVSHSFVTAHCVALGGVT
jgi:hypothetical protein